MEMFIDKYRPTSIDELNFNHAQNKFLISLIKHEDTLPHIILEGTRGSGKKTRTLLFLKEKFGNGVLNIKNYKIQTDIPNKKEPIEMQVLISPYHFQFNPSIHGVHDKVVLQAFINDIVKTKIMTGLPYRILVIEDADLLTFEAQESLRRTLETRISTCRFIFLVNKEGRMIDPLYSRCIPIKISAPMPSETAEILKNIAEKEHMDLPDSVYSAIIKHSHYDVTKAIHYLNLLAVKDPMCKEFKPEDYDDVQKTIMDITSLLIKSTDLAVMEKIRESLYKLMIHNIPPNTIIFKIMEILLPKLKKNICTIYNICNIANIHDDSIRSASKPIYHIEAFCLKVFRELKILAAHKNLDTKKKVSIHKK